LLLQLRVLATITVDVAVKVAFQEQGLILSRPDTLAPAAGVGRPQPSGLRVNEMFLQHFWHEMVPFRNLLDLHAAFTARTDCQLSGHNHPPPDPSDLSVERQLFYDQPKTNVGSLSQSAGGPRKVV
jgi:hypothetical protein